MSSRQELSGLQAGDLVTVYSYNSHVPRLNKIGVVERVTKTTVTVRMRSAYADNSHTAVFSLAHGYQPGHQFYGEHIYPFEVAYAVAIMEDIKQWEDKQLLETQWTPEETKLLAGTLRDYRRTKSAGPS